jgi:hypothetical protein
MLRAVFHLFSLSRFQRRRALQRLVRLHLEALEDRCVPSVTGFRPIDEVGNNQSNSTLGTANTDLARYSPTAYANGVSTPSLPNDLSARVISDILNNQADPANPSQDLATTDQNSLSDFGYAWGQFIDHDMDLTPTSSTEKLTITADPNDPSQMGNQTFFRSIFDPTTGTTDPRQQINAVTSYLDLSQVYGSTTAVADALRTHTGGLLKTSPGNMMPYDNLTYFTQDQLNIIHMANDSGAVQTSQLFVGGDVRANENVELTALQTLFLRNHNRIATELQSLHPDWSDEQLYQEARKINIATEQMITYSAYLPDLLGTNAMPAYTGYNPKVDPSIATEFSTIAFRFGHSMLSGGIERVDNNAQDIPDVNTAGSALSLAQDFFDPNILNPAGVTDPLTGHTSSDIDAILKGDTVGLAQATDLMAIRDIRNLLFANGGLTDNGQDLIARDIERARDDGIGTYNQVRAALGLKQVTSFAQITSNVQVQQELQKAYGNVGNIDPFEGGLAEDHVPGSDMGQLFTAILVKQFSALENGDRFFYLNESWNAEELKLLAQGDTLTKVIEANTHLTNMQADAFRFQATISGTVDLNVTIAGHSVNLGVPGVTVELLNSSGTVVATTRTNLLGQYSFNQLSGPSADPTVAAGISGTGTYSVVLVLPPFLQQTSTPAPITITAGDTHVQNENFGLKLNLASLPPRPALTSTASSTSTADGNGEFAEIIDWLFSNSHPRLF